MKKIFIGCFMALLITGCSHKDKVNSNTAPETTVALGYGDNQVRQPARKPIPPTGNIKVNTMIPNATAFRMSGNYAKNVAISLGPDGNISYFPAPSDITADSEPIDLGNGWWLNCQGIGPNSVFTKYTFAKYAELTEAPSPEQLKLEIIPGARVTQFIELPMKLNQALQDPEAVKEYLQNR